MVEVFKTNVRKVSEAKKIVSLLLEYFPNSRINFDLHDRDKILRVKSENVMPEKVMTLVKEKGFACNVLE
jgi:hypothetical protein